MVQCCWFGYNFPNVKLFSLSVDICEKCKQEHALRIYERVIAQDFPFFGARCNWIQKIQDKEGVKISSKQREKAGGRETAMESDQTHATVYEWGRCANKW